MTIRSEPFLITLAFATFETGVAFLSGTFLGGGILGDMLNSLCIQPSPRPTDGRGLAPGLI